VDGPDPDCNDGVECTVDECDDVNDSCTNAPDDALCDDGLYCTGVETCDAIEDCQPGSAVDCNDNVVCTVDSCDDAEDTCISVPDDFICDDGAYCNGVEICDPSLDCQIGDVPCVGTERPQCREDTDECVECLTHLDCDDRDVCNGVELCVDDWSCIQWLGVDCNGNEIHDGCDIIEGTNEDCNSNWAPDECELLVCMDDPGCDDCNGNGVLDSCDITAEHRTDCNVNLIPDECDVAHGTSQDDNGNSIPDECEEMRNILYVDANATSGGNDGKSWEDAYVDLQSALDAALLEGGENLQIWVADGTYRPSRPTDPDDARTATFGFVDGIAMYGGFQGADSTEYPGGETLVEQRDADPYTNGTVLSGDLSADDVDLQKPQSLLSEPTRSENSYLVVSAPELTGRVVIDGFVIEGGQGEDLSGGGMYAVGGEMHLAHCIVRANANRLDGGGLIYHGGSLELRSCAFIGNFAGDKGGRVYGSESTALAEGCTFVGNVGKRGGGLSIHGGGTSFVTHCRFTSNLAASLGGAVYIGDQCSLTVSNCMMMLNSADRGGAVYSRSLGAVDLVNCTLVVNTGEYEGGALCSALARPSLTNSIVWANIGDLVVGEPAQYCLGPGAPTVHYSCVQDWSGMLGGVGNFADDPLLSDLDGPDDLFGTGDENLRLLEGSPCINAGTNYALPLPGVDIDGGLRIQHCRVDLGAYESGHVPQQTRDCNDNDNNDDCDIFEESAPDCNENQIPDVCDAVGNGDFDGDGQVQLEDFTAFVECLAGPYHPPTALPPRCAATCVRAFDHDGDGDVDLSDLADFERK
jgi:hypothetical protein